MLTELTHAAGNELMDTAQRRGDLRVPGRSLVFSLKVCSAVTSGPWRRPASAQSMALHGDVSLFFLLVPQPTRLKHSS